VIEAIGYRSTPISRSQRYIQRLAATVPVAWLFSRSLHVVDRVLLSRTSGRVSVPRLLAGTPVISLTTVGARSGERRTVPLLAIPHGGDIALIGTNWGQGRTPGWVHNLEANPEATVEYEGRSVSAIARRAGPEEADAVFEAARSVYLGYDFYRKRVPDASVFILSVP